MRASCSRVGLGVRAVIKTRIQKRAILQSLKKLDSLAKLNGTWFCLTKREQVARAAIKLDPNGSNQSGPLTKTALRKEVECLIIGNAEKVVGDLDGRKFGSVDLSPHPLSDYAEVSLCTP